MQVVPNNFIKVDCNIKELFSKKIFRYPPPQKKTTQKQQNKTKQQQNKQKTINKIITTKTKNINN